MLQRDHKGKPILNHNTCLAIELKKQRTDRRDSLAKFRKAIKMKTWITKEEALKCRSKHPVVKQQKDQHEQKKSLLNMHLRLKIRRNSKDLKNSNYTESLCPSLAIFRVKKISFDLQPIMVIGDTKKNPPRNKKIWSIHIQKI